MVFRLNSLTLDESKYSTNSKPRLPFLKPKPSTGSAFYPVVSKSLSYDSGKRASLCSQEVCRTMTEFKHSLNDSIADQLLIESTKKGRPQSPVPDDKGQDFTSAEGPNDIRSLLSHNNDSKAILPNQQVVFPPEIPSQYRTYSQTKSPVPQVKNETIVTIEPVFKAPYKTLPDNNNSRYEEICSDFGKLKYLPKFHGIKGPISTAMEVAPDRPFTPTAVTEPIIKPAPWVPLPIENEDRPESPLIAALKTAPERSYSPLPTFVYASELEPTPIEDPTKGTMSIAESFINSPNSSFRSSEPKNLTRPIGNNPVRYMHGYNNNNNKTPSTSLQNNKTFPRSVQVTNSSKNQTSSELKSYPSSCDKSLISGPYEPVESKSNYNETLITTRAISFKDYDNYLPEYFNSNPEITLSTSQHNISKTQQLSVLDRKSNSIRSMGPGIKNIMSTFTPNTLDNDVPFSKQQSNSQINTVSKFDNKFTSVVDDSFNHKANHPNSVRLTKAVPFFSNSTSISSSPKLTPTVQSPKEFSP